MGALKNSKEKITSKQLALLHIAKSQLGLDDMDYRSVLDLYGGVESAKNLTTDGFKSVMAYLEKIGFKNKAKKVYQKNKPLYADPNGLPYPAQLNKVNQLFIDMEMVEPERQQGFCRRVIKKPWPQTRDETSKVIEGLKAMLARKKKSL